ncbi:MAG: FliA/WhiG family RNA polymerase sigma factor [Desulfobacterales bacterium]|nr:FliA/WhiG family RNA polymerase sigma factor [Desulfobacterales bacterium]
MGKLQLQRKYGKAYFESSGATDEAERGALIARYASLVKFLANRMAMRLPPSVSVDDLISAGMIGLLDAIEKFDPCRKVQFKTYAEFRIRGAILDELRNIDPVPRSTRKKIHDMGKAITAVEKKLRRPADDVEIAEEMGIDLDTYYEILDKARGIELLSLDDYVRSNKDNSESKESYKGLIQGDDNPERDVMFLELRRVVANAIKRLPKKEQMVVSLYYYDELTLKEIGMVMGLTESRISQIHTRAIIRLRAKLKMYQET